MLSHVVLPQRATTLGKEAVHLLQYSCPIYTKGYDSSIPMVHLCKSTQYLLLINTYYEQQLLLRNERRHGSESDVNVIFNLAFLIIWVSYLKFRIEMSSSCMVSFRFKFQILFCDKLIYEIKGHTFQPKYVKFNFGSHGASWVKKVPASFTGKFYR